MDEYLEIMAQAANHEEVAAAATEGFSSPRPNYSQNFNIGVDDLSHFERRVRRDAFYMMLENTYFRARYTARLILMLDGAISEDQDWEHKDYATWLLQYNVETFLESVMRFRELVAQISNVWHDLGFSENDVGYGRVRQQWRQLRIRDDFVELSLRNIGRQAFGEAIRLRNEITHRYPLTLLGIGYPLPTIDVSDNQKRINLGTVVGKREISEVVSLTERSFAALTEFFREVYEWRESDPVPPPIRSTTSPFM